MGSPTQSGPTLDQLAARAEAMDDLPRLALAGAVGVASVIRRKMRAGWMAESLEADPENATVLGLYRVPTDTDDLWPALAVRVVRPATLTGKARRGMVLITRTRPGSWQVVRVKGLPKGAVWGLF